MKAAADAPAASAKRGAASRLLLPLLVALLAAALAPRLTEWRLQAWPSGVGAPLPAAAPAEESACACAAADNASAPASDGLHALTGTVRDCACDYETVDKLNEEVLYPLLSRLVQQPFFRYFKVNLYCDCPLWPDDGMCALPDCSVCECPADEVPLSWRTPPPVAAAAAPAPAAEADCAAGGAATTAEELVNAREGVVNHTLDVGADFRAARAQDNPWTADDEAEAAGATLSYVNLALNPERYTGYAGEHAHRVWAAIYSQPCFQDVSPAGGANGCTRRADVRMFYRLISGMHASITAHIAAEYLVGRGRGAWGRNAALWHARLGSHVEWQENLYFTTLLVTRALLKASDFLAAADYGTGAPEADAATAAAVRALVASPALRAACPVPFDESALFRGPEGPRQREELRAHFRNVSAVMDCVGCEKCRLWGKLQTLGLGTALKILFSLDPGSACPELQRNEVIALVNLLHRLSESLKVNREFAQEWRATGGLPPPDAGEPPPSHAPGGLPSFLL